MKIDIWMNTSGRKIISPLLFVLVAQFLVIEVNIVKLIEVKFCYLSLQSAYLNHYICQLSSFGYLVVSFLLLLLIFRKW